MESDAPPGGSDSGHRAVIGALKGRSCCVPAGGGNLTGYRQCRCRSHTKRGSYISRRDNAAGDGYELGPDAKV